MKKIFLTGITGLLGTNLANRLQSEGYDITAIARNPKRYSGKKSKNLHLIQKDLFDDYDKYLEKIDVVVHIAAVTATNLLHFEEYEKVNYRATVHLFEKAVEKKVSTFIYISTANTIGYGNLINPGTEENPIRKPFNKQFYALSKLKAEEYLIRSNNSLDLRILNPTFMIGPNDSKPSSGKIILRALHKPIVFYPPGGKNFVPVVDVVEAIVQSFTHGKSNERYLITGENMSYHRFYKKLKDITQERQILIRIPGFVLLLTGIIGSLIRKIGIKTSLSLSNMKSLCIQNYYSGFKSIQDLNMFYSYLENAVKESVHYFEKTKTT